MGGKATIYEVAHRCGVSTATVSRIMSDESFGSASTRQLVLDVAAELAWFPNGAARGLASRRSEIVGLLFPDLGQSGEAEDESPLYVDEIIRGAERVATAAGQAVLIAAVQMNNGRSLAFSVAGKVDGLVILARSLPRKDIVALARSMPIVLLAIKPGSSSLDYVAVDNVGGTRQVTEHLLTVHGYQDVAFIGGPQHSPDAEQRFAGYCEALGAAGLKVPEAPDAIGAFTETGGAEATRVLLSEGRRPRALVCANDEMAIGALRTLRGARLRVPADIAVTGFDDIASARHVRPALTTVRQPMRELGEEAVHALFARLRDPKTPRKAIILGTDIVVRRSCGCPTSATRQSTRREQ